MTTRQTNTRAPIVLALVLVDLVAVVKVLAAVAAFIR